MPTCCTEWIHNPGILSTAVREVFLKQFSQGRDVLLYTRDHCGGSFISGLGNFTQVVKVIYTLLMEASVPCLELAGECSDLVC